MQKQRYTRLRLGPIIRQSWFFGPVPLPLQFWVYRQKRDFFLQWNSKIKPRQFRWGSLLGESFEVAAEGGNLLIFSNCTCVSQEKRFFPPWWSIHRYDKPKYVLIQHITLVCSTVMSHVRTTSVSLFPGCLFWLSFCQIKTQNWLKTNWIDLQRTIYMFDHLSATSCLILLQFYVYSRKH